MLYTLVGNGTVNKKEVISSLESLRSAAEGRGDEFWMLLKGEAVPSETVQAILEWLSDGTYYEIVVSPTIEVPSIYAAEHVHTARRPVDRMVTITPQRVQDGEEYAMLVLSDDLDNDTAALYAINQAIDTGIPVYDLGSQMTPLTLEGPEESVVDVVTEEPISQEFTREDLEALTLAELKAQVKATGAVPTDMRSKDAMIDALLGVEVEPPPTTTGVGPLFFLAIVHADGTAEMRPLSNEQAALIG